MNIAKILSVPWSDFSRENIPYGLPFSNGQPFERITVVVFVLTAWAIHSKIRMSSIRMAWDIFSQKMSSVWMACAICSNDLGYPFENKLSSVWTAWHLKKKCYPFKRLYMAIYSKTKLSTIWVTEVICSKINFSRVSVPKQFCHYFASNELLFLSVHVTKFVYKCIMNTVTDLCSFLAIFAFILSFDYWQYRNKFTNIQY